MSPDLPAVPSAVEPVGTPWDPTPKPRPLLWLGLGFVAALVLVGLGRRIHGPAILGPMIPEPAVPVSAAAQPEPATAHGLEAAPENECRLGVVVSSRSVGVAAEAEGRLREVSVRVGDRVAAGQVLARLDAAAAEQRLHGERAALDRARAERDRRRLELDRATREEERRRRLADVLSREEIERAGFQKEQAAADLKAAEAELERLGAQVRRLKTDLDHTEIRAPFDGVVARRYLDPGAVLGPGTPVVKLLGGRDLVRFAVPPDRAHALAVGDAVRLETAAGAPATRAVVQGRAPEIDAAAQMIFFEASFADDAVSLSPGSVVRVAPSTSPGSCFDPRSVNPSGGRRFL